MRRSTLIPNAMCILALARCAPAWATESDASEVAGPAGDVIVPGGSEVDVSEVDGVDGVEVASAGAASGDDETTDIDDGATDLDDDGDGDDDDDDAVIRVDSDAADPREKPPAGEGADEKQDSLRQRRALLELDDDNGWPAGSIQEQLDRDATLVPYGKGAIFVPSLTNGLDEPPLSVWQGDTKVAEGTTGRRLVMLPGQYTVEMGSGASEGRFTIDVEVRELQVSVVPVTWAGLSIHMVDERLASVRGTYEIIRVESREYIDVGFGADEQAGEPVTTWILQPGLYKIVRVGETYRARRDFATVRLVEGDHTDFLLVVDPETDTFQGAGEVPRNELFRAGQGAFWWTFIFGGDVNMSSRQNVLGLPNGESFSFRAFLDTKMSAMIFESPLILQLQIEEGAQIAGGLFTQDDSLDIPWTKLDDRVDLDLLYVYQLFPWLGPYLRFNAETNLIESLHYYDEPTHAVVIDEDGNFKNLRPARDTVRLQPSFGLTSFKEGVGINLRVLKALWGESSLRVGLGARHTITNRLIQTAPTVTPIPVEAQEACEEEECVVYTAVDSANTIGPEATLLATLRVTRWALINIEADTLIPFDDIRNIVVDIETTLALKLTSFVSINYVFRYLRDPALSSDPDTIDRFSQEVRIRFSVELP